MIVVDWKAFGERILIARRRLNLSQAQLAERVGISRNYISMIERGIADPSYVIIVNICDFLQIETPPDRLMD